METGPSAAAFETWVAPHLPAMWLLASRLAGAAERDEVYQEALLAAWSRWPSYDATRGSELTWLLVLVADHARRARRRRRATAGLPGDLVAVQHDVDRRLDLTAAIARLPPRQRLAVELFYGLDLSLAQTAAVMGCATGTVSSTLSDARRALRAQLEVVR